MSFVSFAQNFEDVMLWRALKGVERGFYVDIGAWSATFDSVTRAFYERGWRGINVEPNPPYYNELIRHRPHDINLQKAVSDVTGHAEMYFVPNSGLSSLDEAVARDVESLGLSLIAAEVELTTLAAIWTSHVPAGQDVHFLKVDVEGAEEAVLRGNDWGRNRPWIVIVEATKPSSRVDSYCSWESLLTMANYTFAYADGLNRFYVAAEQKHLAEAFRYPPNVFDGLIRLREYEAETRAAMAEEAREQFAAQAAAAEKAREQLQAQAAAAEKAREQLQAQAAAAEKAREQLQAQAAEEVTAREQLQAQAAAAEKAREQLQAQAAAAEKAREQLQAQAAEEVTALKACHAEVLAHARDDIDALQGKVTTLSAKLARAESVIDYVTQRKLLERIFFRPNGRPVKPLRCLLFQTSGKPRRLFKRVVLHRDATPRKAFAYWMQNQTYLARAATQRAVRLTAERDALGEANGVAEAVRDLEARLTPPPRSASRGFARRVEKQVVRPVAHRLRSFLAGGRSDQVRQRDHRIESLSSPPAPQPFPPAPQPSPPAPQPSPPAPQPSPPSPQYDVLSEMRRLALEMENVMLTLAMERGADAWPVAAPAPPEPAPTLVRIPLLLPSGRTAEVACASDDLPVDLDRPVDGQSAQEDKTPLAPMAAFRFVQLVLPTGTTYELSVDEPARDNFHQAVAAGEANDANWRFIMNWVRPGDVVFDVGANIGTISIPVAMSRVTVHAFELLASNVQHLLRAGARNGVQGLSVVLGAVSDRHSPVGIGGFSAWGTTAVQNAPLSIATVVLDQYIQERRLDRVDLVKIDAEGSELQALNGLQNCISEFEPDFVIEGNVITSGNAGYSCRRLLEFLESFGYRIFRLHSDCLFVWDSSHTQEAIIADYFASKKTTKDIGTRSGLEVREMSVAEIVESIEMQNLMPDLHKQYLVAVSNLLPAVVTSNPRVSSLLSQWAHLNNEDVRSVLMSGIQ